MSGTDDRVVSMHFDNAAFQQNVNDTLKSLDILKKSLNFDESQKSIGDLDNAGKKFSLEGMHSAAEGVSAKFLAMATVGITALSNITNRAVDAGLQFAKSFTVAPIMDGFHEFETEVGSIQTILANTARFNTGLPEVQKSLDALNTYADKTIYSFGDMTKNIGLFTNAGIKVGDATSMIKGFSNAAAASGTTAEGASGAAYQLSQALSAGTIRLMDWRSLTNVGMGNKNMQEGLIQIAQAMGRFNETGDNAADVQKGFNQSLESGWLSADVMSKYLNIMSGEMSKAQIKALGLTDAQVTGFQKQAATALDAATKVRTFTQLVGTIKEAVGSGWADTFRLVLGNFDQATKLFTDINNSVSTFVQNSANARNNLLKGWADLGGRTMLINAFKDAIAGVASWIKPIKEAFREFFPPETAKGLMSMTRAFADFAGALKIGGDTADKVKRIFAGIFALFDIAGNIVKQLWYTLLTLLDTFRGAGGGALEMGANLGDLLVKLDNFLVKGGKLNEWGLTVRETINNVADRIGKFADGLSGFFDIFRRGEEPTNKVLAKFDGLAGSADKTSGAFDRLRDIFDRLKSLFESVAHVVEKILDPIINWFKELGANLANAMKPGDFNSALDAINVGLLGGLVLMLKRFLSGGGLGDALSGGLLDKIKGALGAVTTQLQAMQTQLKAKALMEIAIAMGVLTASIVALSMIDSAKLTKAMVAIGVGFGELLGAMKVLDEIGGKTKDNINIGILTAAMIAMSTSAVILAGAVAIFGNMNVDTLAKGLGGLAAGIGILIGALKVVSGDTAGVIASSVAMTAMATALTILGGAVEIFGHMSFGDLAKGLVGVGVALALIVAAMNLLPGGVLGGVGLAAAGVGMVLMATSLTILAGAVKLFSLMSWGDLAKGLAAIAAALVLIGAAMYLMPPSLPITAAGMVILSVALTGLAGAVKLMGSMKLGTLAKGIGGFAAMLTVLAVGMYAMEGALPGAAALLVVAAAMSVLAKVVTTLGGMDIKELAIGIGAIAAVIAVLGISAAVMQPLIPALLGLGAALGLVGAAFALFGVGAYLTAKAFQALAESGVAGMKALVEAIVIFIKGIPTFVAALISSLVTSADEFFKAGTLLLKLATVFLGQLLDTIITLAPKIAEAIVTIVTAALKLIRDKFPDVIATAFDLLMTFLGTLLSHTAELVQTVVAIMVIFANTMSNNATLLVNAAVGLLLAFLGAIANRIGDIQAAGLNILLAIIAGMANNMIRVVNFGVQMIIAFAQTIADNIGKVISAGADIIVQLLNGMARNTNKVITAGADFIISLMTGVAQNTWRVVNAAFDILTDFLNALADTIRRKTPELQKAGLNVVTAIIDGMTGGLASKAKGVIDGIGDLASKGLDKAKGIFGIHSPSREFYMIAQNLGLGFAHGLDDDTASENSVIDHAERIVRAFQETLSKIPDSLEGMDELNPVIRPVLDLSKVQEQSGDLNAMFSGQSITPNVSLDQARVISALASAVDSLDTTSSDAGPPELKFEQNIYAPKALSTSDIYRDSKSLIATAKEELNIS